MSTTGKGKETESDHPNETTTTTRTTTAPSRSIKPFDGSNYNIWSAHMKNILYERQTIKYISQRNDITDYDEREDRQALLEIQFTLADNQMKHVINCTTAHDAWEKLRSIHLHTSASNRMFLKNQFLGLTMKKNERM